MLEDWAANCQNNEFLRVKVSLGSEFLEAQVVGQILPVVTPDHSLNSGALPDTGKAHVLSSSLAGPRVPTQNRRPLASVR